VNLPNLLTLSRIPILFGIVGLLYFSFSGSSTLAFIFFILGALTDWADGYVARKQGLVSNFGKLMDALTDKVFMVGLFISFLVIDDILPFWALPLLLLILTREFLITGLRLVAATTGVVLAAEKSGKHKTVSQIVSAILLLFSLSVREDFSRWLPDRHLGNVLQFADILHIGGLVFFVIATVLTVSSGAQYMVKYWSIFTGEDAVVDEEP